MGVSYPHPQDAPYSFDVAQAAAFLNPNIYEVIFIDGVVEKLFVGRIVKRIISYRPDILALTATSSVDLIALEIFKKTRKSLPGLYIIGFGQHANYSPHTFLNQSFHIDACVYGEPEVTLVELIEKKPRTQEEKEKISGIYYWNCQLQKTPERPLTIDLDEWPFPRYDFFKDQDYRVFSTNFPSFRRIRPGWVLAARGCPYQPLPSKAFLF